VAERCNQIRPLVWLLVWLLDRGGALGAVLKQQQRLPQLGDLLAQQPKLVQERL
jgi:hypothetical protein